MLVSVNIQQLEKGSLPLEGDISPEDLDLESKDELIRFGGSVRYRLEVQKVEDGVLVQGTVDADVVCDCARCLRTFNKSVALPGWTAHLPLEGEDAVPVVGDCVDLTPYLREDILLALPQHPLCSEDCQGLLSNYERDANSHPDKGVDEDQSSPWGKLDKLDL